MADQPGSLAEFVASVAPKGTLRVEENLGGGFVRLRVAEAERRQAKHDIRCVEDIVVEMLRNSRDAGASRVFVATTREGDQRTVVVLDDGCGVPDDMRDRIFEARVTSKLESMHMDRWGVHGRGMALFSVHENAEEARVMASCPGGGTSIRVITDASSLPEKTDQSTWPSVGVDDDGMQAVVRGPHNIIRTCCEFALEERGRVELFLGSPAEIAATIRARVRPRVSQSDLLFVDDLSDLPVLERLYAAGDAGELVNVCTDLGLDMSERTAHRILAGQIKPQRGVLARLSHRSDESAPQEVDLMRDRRGLRIAEEDVEDFARAAERAFDLLAARYYLTLQTEPRVRVSRNKITVTYDIEKQD
ncbi:MAG: ATP-binding protein [Atopobiaceae bacterium]|nr:ATP-binding protein [Atopobiaceae bacterium]